MDRISGMYAALLSGFDDDGAFSPNRQRSIIDYVSGQGLDGLYIGGSSGESALMTTDELLEQQKVIADYRNDAAGRIIAHVGVPSTRDSVTLAKQAEALGFDALSALPPHGYPFSDDEIYEYYKELTSATKLPFIIYEIPLRTHRPLPMDLLLRLADLPNVAGIKFTSTELPKLAELRRARPDLATFFGFDEMYLSAASLGSDGGIGTTYNVLGKLFAALNAAVKLHDLELAQRLQTISQEYVEVLVRSGVLPGVKLTLQILGHDVGSPRPPFQCKNPNAEAELRKFLSRADVKEWLA